VTHRGVLGKRTGRTPGGGAQPARRPSGHADAPRPGVAGPGRWIEEGRYGPGSYGMAAVKRAQRANSPSSASAQGPVRGSRTVVRRAERTSRPAVWSSAYRSRRRPPERPRQQESPRPGQEIPREEDGRQSGVVEREATERQVGQPGGLEVADRLLAPAAPPGQRAGPGVPRPTAAGLGTTPPWWAPATRVAPRSPRPSRRPRSA